METYYYDIRKQVFEYDEVMNNQRRAVYSERRRVLDGRALKKQVIGYGERTMSEIVEAYVNPDLPPEEWDLDQLVGKVSSSSVGRPHPRPGAGPRHGGTQGLPAGATPQSYDLRKVRSNSSVRSDEEAEASSSFSRSTRLAEHLQAMNALRESVGLRGYGQKIP